MYESSTYILPYILTQVTLVRGVKPFHYFFNFIFGGLFDPHFFSCQTQNLIQLVPLYFSVVVDVDHVERCVVNKVQLILFFHELSPHTN